MKSILATILFSLCVSLTAWAQQPQEEERQGQLSIKQHQVILMDDSVYWNMDLSVQGLVIGKTQSLSFTPVIYSLDSLHRVQLPPVVLMGKDKQRLNARKKALANKYKVDPCLEHTTLVYSDNDTITTIPYEISFKYEEWMQESGFRIVGERLNYEGYPMQTYVDIMTEELRIGIANRGPLHEKENE